MRRPVTFHADAVETDLVGHVLGAAPSDDRIALVDYARTRPRRWSYAALKEAISALAAHLRSSGLQADDVVAVLTENSAEFVISYYGVLAAGGIVLPLDPRTAEAEWQTDVTRCRVQTMIVDTALWPDYPSLPYGSVRIGGGTAPRADGCPWDAAITTSAEGALSAFQPSGGGRIAVLMSSSGTQGKPKKVQVTHGNLTAGLDQVAKVHRLGIGDVITCAGPLRHIYGMQMAMNPVLRAGGMLLIGPVRFELGEFLRIMAAEEVSVAYLVPIVIGGIATLPVPPALPALRLIVSGGGPLPTTAAEGCARQLGKPVVQGFGMTEAGCISFTADGQPGPDGSVGTILPGTEARFLDPETGEDVDHGRPGELVLRGPQIAPGYLDMSAPPTRDGDGWFHTGDLALLGQDGFLRIVGRLKSLIKYKGYQVAPAELEEILLEHHAVTDVVVTGEPDRITGQIPKAFVVASHEVPLAELAAHVAARVPPYKRVRAIERVHEIPRSATGKAMRPPALRVVVLEGVSESGSEFATELAAAGMSVLITGTTGAVVDQPVDEFGNARGKIVTFPADLAHASPGDEIAAAVARELGGLDIVLDARSADLLIQAGCGADPRTCADPVMRRLLRVFEAGRGRVIIAPDPASDRSRVSEARAAHRDFVEQLAIETSGAGVCVIGFEPGDRDEASAGAMPDTVPSRGSSPEARRAIVALATGAADHCSGRYFGSAVEAALATVDSRPEVAAALTDREQPPGNTGPVHQLKARLST